MFQIHKRFGTYLAKKWNLIFCAAIFTICPLPMIVLQKRCIIFQTYNLMQNTMAITSFYTSSIFDRVKEKFVVMNSVKKNYFVTINRSTFNHTRYIMCLMTTFYSSLHHTRIPNAMLYHYKISYNIFVTYTISLYRQYQN